MSKPIILILLVAGIVAFVVARSTATRTVRIGEGTFKLEVAATADARARGLGGRRSLAPERGMLFIFQDAARHGIWMKDMRFPIDILWLKSESGRRATIIDIAPGVRPSPGTATDALPIFYPRDLADTIIELPSGAAARSGAKIGDAIEYE